MYSKNLNKFDILNFKFNIDSIECQLLRKNINIYQEEKYLFYQMWEPQSMSLEVVLAFLLDIVNKTVIKPLENETLNAG